MKAGDLDLKHSLCDTFNTNFIMNFRNDEIFKIEMKLVQLQAKNDALSAQLLLTSTWLGYYAIRVVWVEYIDLVPLSTRPES